MHVTNYFGASRNLKTQLRPRPEEGELDARFLFTWPLASAAERSAEKALVPSSPNLSSPDNKTANL